MSTSATPPSTASGAPSSATLSRRRDEAGGQAQSLDAARDPEPVKGLRGPGPDVPRAYPYGIYDIGRNTGFVNVGTDHDTGAFAVASIRGWWRAEGRRLYPQAAMLVITADVGGSNGYRLRLWKVALQRLADDTGLIP